MAALGLALGWMSSWGGGLEGRASAVEAGQGGLLLGQAHELLPDGLDEGGRGVRGGYALPLKGTSGRVTQAGGVQVGRWGGGLPHSQAVSLKHRQKNIQDSVIGGHNKSVCCALLLLLEY